MELGTRCAGAWLAVAACVFLVGCGIYSPKDFMHGPQPSAARAGETFASVELDRVTYAVQRGQQIGIYRGGGSFTGCGLGGRSYPAYWSKKMVPEVEDLSETFFQVMRDANYNALGNPAEMFGDVEGSAPKPDYLVGGRVESIEADLCDVVDLYSTQFIGAQRGSALMTVTWQVFSTLERKIVFETKTVGSGIVPQESPAGLELIVAKAFASAAANLAADPKFHDLLVVKPTDKSSLGGAGAPSDAPALSITRVTPYENAISANIDQIERGVVTVIVGGGHGSGFFISPKLVLTNHHVAGGSARVKLRFVDGTETYAKVLRAHAGRDVALLEVEEGSFNPIPIRGSAAVITEEVYAVGSPLDESLSGTVTRGIVSQIKPDERGLTFIQADASIQHGNSGGPLLDARGNVVGISDMALTDQADSTMGINFFIPIAEALKALNVTLN